MVKGLQVQLSGGSNNVKAVELSIPGCLKELRTAVRSALRPHLDGKKFSLTNFTKDVKDDEGVQALSEGEKLWAVILDPSNHVVPTKERVTFQPHPNTLTMAGELEYWAAQGRSPLPYALSELIDNALRATRNNRSSRRIVITLAISGGSTPSAGLISVWDNGCGMTKRELNDWAVMNLSMEDRGEQPLEPDVGHGPTQRNGPERFLSGNLSYFGVGSKNAAFFMGGCTKVVTKSAQSSFVHELSLAAGELEERYRKQQDVYAEDLMHRSPRDASTLAAIESGFEPLAKAWVAAEAMADTSEEEGAGKSFTRVLIGQIKPNILCQIADQSAMKQLRRDLSHLYHYYLHGPQGSRSHGQTGSQPRDGTLPEITVEGVIGGRAAWSVNLADVTDDLESQYLQAQRAELQFSLMVPGKGTVAGALYYFPFQDERETLPAEGAVASQPEPITTYNMTQQPMASQLPTQAPPQSGGADAADEDGNSLWQRSRAPLFSAFWQGRLIPGARIESLPFIEAVRVKRSSASRDALPDEAFMRLRGSLFFGPAFLVTRNKLTFRDNLQELLASSSPGDRTNLERKFREWLTKCHATLDKRIRFVGLADPAMQAAVRSSRGEDVTAFARIEDGSRSVTQGDVVRLNVKPALMGMVLYFSVQQAVRTEGVYANGSVAVRPLPEEVHGTAAERTVPLRRLEGGPVQRQELDDYLAKELLKVPSSLRLEPIRLATGNAVELTAGASIPATGVTVLNGSGQHVIRGFLAGEKQSFSVVQRLWRLHAQPGEGNAQPEAAPAEEEPQRPPKKRKKPSKGQKAAEKTPEPVADMLAGVLIIEVHNHTPNKDCFRFERIEKGLKKAGTYRLDYELQPCLPGKGPLTISTQLTVSSGPLACFDLQGEGRTLLASREFMLGEHLPCLQLMPRDGCGNKLDSEVERLKDVSVEVVSGPTDDGSAPEVIQDLQASFQVAEDQGRVLIKSAQVLGCNLGSVTSVFAGSPTPNPVSIPQAQQQPASQQIIAAETVQMRFCVRGLEPQLIPLRLRPGAPVGLRLLPAHPFSAQVGAQADEAAAVMTQLPPERTAALALTLPSGGALPGFHVQAIDAWGNAAGPTDALPCDVTVDCNALSPAQASFSICASGRAYVDGLVGASGGAALGRRVPLTFSIVCRPADADAATAVAAAGPPQPLVCALEVEPSTAPAAILLLHDGQPLPRRELEGEDGETETVFVVEDIAAGSELAGLAMQCVDAAGRPVAEGTPGKVRATWIQGTKKLKFGPDGTFALLDIRVKEDVTEVETYDVKFKSAGPAPEVLEATLMVLKVPASAHVWQLRLDEAASSQARSQDDVDMRNGCPFSLEVEALDRFGNRCPGGAAGALPAPLLSADSERKLEYDADAWARSWSPQGSGEVLSVSVTLRGRPGLVRMHVRDVAGPAGSSALTPDTLELKLAAGQMSGLAFEGPPSLACGMRHVLPALRVIAVDDFGNRTTCPAFEVSLAPSALAADGSGVAAAITAPGGNKAKVKDGEAVFKNVRIEADSPGAYTLRVKSASRKVAGDASVELQLTATNAVKALALREDSLPLEGCQAGSSLTLFAEVATEDEAALDGEAAAQGLALRLTPPGSSRSDDIVISPSEGGGAQEQGIYAFCTEALVASGEWTAVVEYTEQRPELSKALTKREAVLRSTAATFQVLPGPAVALALDCGAAGERLAATNGADARERLLLAGAALQLQDEHGNAAAAGGHRVRLSLHWPPSNQDGNGSELPKLEVEGAAVRKTDECGRAFFGDVSLGEGSGRVAPDENAGGNARQGGAIELVLVAEVAGLGTADTKQWVRAWSCSVLFSDNVASFAAVKELTDRHAALSMERDRLQDRLSTTGRAAQAANKELKARTKEVAECRRPLGRNAPETVAAAEAALSRLQNGAHEPQAQQPQVEARFGDPSARMTEALRRCLALEDEEVVGCVAQLATVSDGALARLLSASYCGMMPLLVTKTPAAQKRVTQHLAKHKCEVPDMLSMTMCAPFTGKDGASPGFDRASKRAKELSAAACDGTDPPLALPLPHTRILHSRKGGASSEDLELGATDWPEGCLGYAFNLLRPTQPGHRRQLMFSAFGTQLVFETLEDASKYREFVTQVLRSGMPQVVTLRDFRCITGIGVVRGTSWQVPTLEETHYRFGTTAGAGGSSGRGEGDEAEEAALEALLDALRAKDEAAERHQAARAEAESTEVQYRGELEELEVQIRELDAQLSSQHAPAGGARQRAKKRRSAGEGKDISVAEDVEVQNVGGEPQQDRRSKRRR